jgi:hydroxyethylthiazole kinase-like uncharacterized protein yjeF
MNTQTATSPYRPLFNVAQIRAAEASLFTRVDSFQVMHRAASAVAEYVLNQFSMQPVAICCGPGNNGGDGWLVAHYLRQAGWPVRVYAHGAPECYRGDAHKAAILYGGAWQDLETFHTDESELIIDALFGIGLNAPIRGRYVEVIARIQASSASVVSVDIPSGVHADTGAVLGCAVRADATVSFGVKRIGHLLLPGLSHVGRLVIADIGLKKADFASSPYAMENGRPQLPCPPLDSHKYSRGQVLVYGGAEMTGAARLSALAAARAGAGMVRVAAPESAYDTYAQSLMSVIVERMGEGYGVTDIACAHPPDALVFGPGAGVQPDAQDALQALLQTDMPLVLDADAIRMLSHTPLLRDMLAARKAPACMTPHEGEYMRLARAMGLDTRAHKLKRAADMANALGVVVLLKGADSVIAAPDGRVVINTAGPVWLATAGSGDVLAGLIAGLIAQGSALFDAVCAAVWLHSAAGQKAGRGLIAEDLLETIPQILKEIA